MRIRSVHGDDTLAGKRRVVLAAPFGLADHQRGYLLGSAPSIAWAHTASVAWIPAKSKQLGF